MEDKTKLEIGKIYESKIDFEPLIRKGDKFKVVKINNDKDLMTIEAISLRNRVVLGFNEGELEEIKNGN